MRALKPGRPARERAITGKLDDLRTTTLGSNGPEVGVTGLGCIGMTHSYDMENAEMLRRPSCDTANVQAISDLVGPPG